MPKAPKGGSNIQRIEIKRELSPKQSEELLNVLQTRFSRNMARHPGLVWAKVQAKLSANMTKLSALSAMESTGGEPDVIGFDEHMGEYIFADCSAETPVGRRNVCYDRAGEEKREKQGIFPAGNAMDLAKEMGIELMTEAEYRELQKLGSFDTKTSSWLKTPQDIRKLDGALFADRRFGHVFIYHNTAPSFYGVRGFRGMLKV